MTTYFTVDRSNKLSPGIIELETDYSSTKMYTIENLISKEELISRTQTLYPRGLSFFGLRYLHTECLIVKDSNTGKTMRLAPHEPILEGLIEQIRINEFPSRPSRMQSIFGWCNLNDAKEFNKENGGLYNIYEVESENAFIGDQNLLYLGGSIMAAFEFARKYWSGERTKNCKLEAVIPLPARIQSFKI